MKKSHNFRLSKNAENVLNSAKKQGLSKTEAIENALALLEKKLKKKTVNDNSSHPLAEFAGCLNGGLGENFIKNYQKG